MKNLTVHFTEKQLDEMDDLQLIGIHENRSETIQTAVRWLLIKKWDRVKSCFPDGVIKT